MYTAAIASTSSRLSTEADESRSVQKEQDTASGGTRSARFYVPSDVFLNPSDPPRHQLLHDIQREEWFRQQSAERSLSADEAARIPSAVQGESVLLGFFARSKERSTGSETFICTICSHSTTDPKPYGRPDHARVHMRHHLGQRPIQCTGECKKSHWYGILNTATQLAYQLAPAHNDSLRGVTFQPIFWARLSR